jgi:hypothetical protein
VCSSDLPKFLWDVADEFGMYCFPTGSRSWGVNNENSDYDFCVTSLIEFSGMERRLKAMCSSIGSYGSTKFRLDWEGLDMIAIEPSQFLSWYHATEMMKVLPKNKLVDKKERIKLFEELVKLV